MAISGGEIRKLRVFLIFFCLFICMLFIFFIGGDTHVLVLSSVEK